MTSLTRIAPVELEATGSTGKGELKENTVHVAADLITCKAIV